LLTPTAAGRLAASTVAEVQLSVASTPVAPPAVRAALVSGVYGTDREVVAQAARQRADTDLSPKAALDFVDELFALRSRVIAS